MRKSLFLPVIAITLICLCLATVLFWPPVRERVTWHANETLLKIQYKLNPPEKVVFEPQEKLPATLQAASAPSAAPSPMLSITWTPALTATATATPAPTSTPVPLPARVDLKGVRYEDQHGRWNYCAPANLAMALSFWGWQGDRDVVGPALKPEEKDKNVMPYEMVNYVESQTDLGVALRVGGDLDSIKRFLASGYPVLVEKGTYLRDISGVVSWMGHYQVITGYDEASGTFIAQDSFVEPDHLVPYEDMIKGWRAFNYTYLIIYPREKEAEVLSLLGPNADQTVNFQNAAQKAADEIYGLSGIDQYFAWYNRGTNLVQLQDYAGAATAYDEAFAVYPTIPEAERPWRMLWYQTGPYFAYFYSGRYYDTLYLADGTLNAMQGDKNLEESYYWRGMARSALGDADGAIQDFRTSLQYHPGFEPAVYQLNLLGVQNP